METKHRYSSSVVRFADNIWCQDKCSHHTEKYMSKKDFVSHTYQFYNFLFLIIVRLVARYTYILWLKLRNI